MTLWEPRRPKGYFGWSLRKRQLFAKYIWSPWWEIYKFFKSGPCNMAMLMVERAKFRYLIWKEMRKSSKEWRKHESESRR